MIKTERKSISDEKDLLRKDQKSFDEKMEAERRQIQQDMINEKIKIDNAKAHLEVEKENLQREKRNLLKTVEKEKLELEAKWKEYERLMQGSSDILRLDVGGTHKITVSK